MSKKPILYYGYVIVALSFIISAVGLGISNTFGIFLEPMLAEFGWSRSSISAAFSLTALIGGIIGIVTGRLTDKFGPRLVLIASALFLGSGYLLMSLVHDPWQMYLYYGVLTGIGIAGPIVPLYTTSIRWFTHGRALVTGIISSGMSAGTIVFSQLVEWLITEYDWRSTFIIIGIINIVIISICAQFMKRDPQSAIQFSKVEIQNAPQSSAKLSESGLSLRQTLTTRQFWLFSANNCLVALSIFTIIAHLVIHARDLQIPNAAAVSLLSYINITSIISRMVMGLVADKIGHRITITLGVGLIFISLIWLIFSTNLWMLILFSIVFGFGWGTFFVPINPLAAELFGMKSLGVITGALNVGITLGGTLGPVIAGYIFDIQKSYHLDFIFLAVASLIAILLLFALRRSQPQIDIQSVL